MVTLGFYTKHFHVQRFNQLNLDTAILTALETVTPYK